MTISDSSLCSSSQVGGVGITLTSATRAVIYEPSWNPADDRQAVDRIYRIGQDKPCTIYRFAAAGTVEERMYEKQVFKDGVRRSVFGGNNETLERYFGKDELKDLFTLGEEGTGRIVEFVRGLEGKENGLGSIVLTPMKTYASPLKAGTKPAWTPTRNTASTPTRSPAKSITGGTGKRTFLETHPKVVGVTAHDALYVKDASAGTPFGKNNATTPSRGRSQRRRRRG